MPSPSSADFVRELSRDLAADGLVQVELDQTEISLFRGRLTREPTTRYTLTVTVKQDDGVEVTQTYQRDASSGLPVRTLGHAVRIFAQAGPVHRELLILREVERRAEAQEREEASQRDARKHALQLEALPGLLSQFTWDVENIWEDRVSLVPKSHPETLNDHLHDLLGLNHHGFSDSLMGVEVSVSDGFIRLSFDTKALFEKCRDEWKLPVVYESLQKNLKVLSESVRKATAAFAAATEIMEEVASRLPREES